MSEFNATNASPSALPKALESTHSKRSSSWGRFKRNRPALLSLWFLVGLLVLVGGWPLVLNTAKFIGPNGAAFAQSHDPDKLSDEQFEAPNARHWFGTDVHGRDLFSRVIYGARVSLFAGIIATGVSLLIGVFWGAVAGFFGGRIDALMMRFVDVLYSLPSIIFVIVLITSLEGIVKNWLVALGVSWLGLTRFLFLLVGLGAVSWLTMARIVRGQVLSLRRQPFVEASQVLGGGPGHILARHIIPHTYGIVIVYLTLTVPGIMLYESFLSYLGLGIQPPMASWGSLIAEGADQINPIRIYWWLIVFPGGFLISTLLALSFLGDGLGDVWGREGKS